MESIEVDSRLIRDIMAARQSKSRKGDNGIVLVVGGSAVYHGAPVLSSLAALRSGTDLVYTFVPKANLQTTRTFSPNLIVLPFTSDKKDARFTARAAKAIIDALPKNPHSAAIGMGMNIGKPEALLFLIRQLMLKGQQQQGRQPTRLLLDASALIPQVLKEISGTNTVITPHPGEYKRIFNESAGETREEMTANVSRLAKRYGITIILKGWVNIISDGAKVAAIKRSTPSMTVGGTGDILSGIVAGFLSKRIESFWSSVLGVYFNGIAAKRAYNLAGLHLLATDLIQNLPLVIKPFDKITPQRSY